MSAPTWRVEEGDALAVLRTMPAASVHICVTSPPYFSLRSYLPDGHAAKALEMGSEPTPEAWAARLVEVFREVARVLRPDGILWLNLGDSYASVGGHTSYGSTSQIGTRGVVVGDASKDARNLPHAPIPAGLKPKDLMGQPWLLAFALRADGWFLRAEIIWAKGGSFGPWHGAVMPESCRDRPTRAHETVFLLSRSPNYFYDGRAVAEPAKRFGDIPGGSRKLEEGQATGATHRRDNCERLRSTPVASERNLRSVWQIGAAPSPRINGVAHYAAYPVALVTPRIQAGTSAGGVCAKCGAPRTRVTEPDTGGSKGTGGWHEDDDAIPADTRMGSNRARDVGYHRDYRRGATLGWEPSCACGAEAVPATVLDCFSGTATTGVAALRLGRSYVGIELSPEYAAASRIRLAAEQSTADPASVRRALGTDAALPLFGDGP